jgi:hypothetical protein
VREDCDALMAAIVVRTTTPVCNHGDDNKRGVRSASFVEIANAIDNYDRIMPCTRAAEDDAHGSPCM